MNKNNYAILEMRGNEGKTIETLERFGLSLVQTEDLTPFKAMVYFGIVPMREQIERFKDVIVLIVSGTKEAYEKYCADPTNDVGEYWSR